MADSNKERDKTKLPKTKSRIKTTGKLLKTDRVTIIKINPTLIGPITETGVNPTLIGTDKT